VVDEQGVVAVGAALEGRGAWLCLDPTCWERAVRTKALPRALRRPVGEEGAALLDRLHAMLDDCRRE